MAQKKSWGDMTPTQKLWAPALSVQPVGPLAYLLVGRKR